MGIPRNFNESLKILEADIHHANTLAVWFPKTSDGSYFQMRLSYSPIAPFLIFLVQWMDCSLAGFLGLLQILIYKVHADGSTTMIVHERRASLHEFYGNIYPSLVQLQGGLSEKEMARQEHVCRMRYSSKDSGCDSSLMSSDIWSQSELKTQQELETECGICLEESSKVGLPGCLHTMCQECFQDWKSRFTTCPFCREKSESVNSEDVWVFVEKKDAPEPLIIQKFNHQRLVRFVEKLPVVFGEPFYAAYDLPYC